ncbi:hypothetical protein [Maribacter sp. 2-571]|uniref:hypothetical protein n=1 Tax=Maribacter sp. 2-571 TaxID=3417569 RepID=UPI003D32AED5
MLDFSFSSKQKMAAFYLGNFKAKMVLGFLGALWGCHPWTVLEVFLSAALDLAIFPERISFKIISFSGQFVIILQDNRFTTRICQKTHLPQSL